jgi:hypothetical protein
VQSCHHDGSPPAIKSFGDYASFYRQKHLKNVTGQWTHNAANQDRASGATTALLAFI